MSVPTPATPYPEPLALHPRSFGALDTNPVYTLLCPGMDSASATTAEGDVVRHFLWFWAVFVLRYFRAAVLLRSWAIWGVGAYYVDVNDQGQSDSASIVFCL